MTIEDPYMVRFTQIPTPIGDLLATDLGAGLASLTFPDQRGATPIAADWQRDPGPFREVAEAIEAYFAGEPVEFDLPLDLRGTELQRQVWQALLDCPYGRTTTYREVAQQVGRPTAARAVGGAIGRNPVAIVVPCHRVIATDGSLTGYAGGVDRKRHLLALEDVLVA